MFKVCAFASAVVALGVYLQRLGTDRRRRGRKQTPPSDDQKAHRKQDSDDAREKQDGIPATQQQPRPTLMIPAHRADKASFPISVQRFKEMVLNPFSWWTVAGRMDIVTCRTTGRHFVQQTVTYDAKRPLSMLQATLRLYVSTILAASAPLMMPCAAFRDATTAYLVSPFCPAGSLDSYFVEYEQSTAEVCRFFAGQLIMALCSLHDRHLAMRNLSFDSTRVAEDGYVVLWDFSHVVDVRTSASPNPKLGRSKFLAPEVATGQSSASLAADVWSLGVMIYRIVVGEFPFTYFGDEAHVDPLYVRYGWQVPAEGVLRVPEVRQFFNSIFQAIPEHRSTARELCSLPLFRGVNWHALALRAVASPIRDRVAELHSAPTPLAALEIVDRPFTGPVLEIPEGSKER